MDKYPQATASCVTTLRNQLAYLLAPPTCGAGSVHPSVCMSDGLSHIWPPHTAAAGLLLWARRAGDINRLLHGRRANTGSAMLSAYEVAEHKLVSSSSSQLF